MRASLADRCAAGAVEEPLDRADDPPVLPEQVVPIVRADRAVGLGIDRLAYQRAHPDRERWRQREEPERPDADPRDPKRVSRDSQQAGDRLGLRQTDVRPIRPSRRGRDDPETVLQCQPNVADALTPVDAVVVAERATAFVTAPGRGDHVLAARDSGRDRVPVAGDAAERVDEPPQPGKLVDPAMHDPVRVEMEPIVDRDHQHAHVPGPRPAVIADDQLRLRAVQMLEALDRVAMIALLEAPDREPEAERKPVGVHGPTRTRIAPYDA